MNNKNLVVAARDVLTERPGEAASQAARQLGSQPSNGDRRTSMPWAANTLLTICMFISSSGVNGAEEGVTDPAAPVVPDKQTAGQDPLPPPKPIPGQALRTYLAHAFTPYEPLYFLVQPNPGNAKVQLSFAMMVIGRAVKPEGSDERRDGLYFGYTQVSFWDLEAQSKPFFDNNYNPEGWWHTGGLPAAWLGVDNFSLEAGIGHESNGQEGVLSRSRNYLLLRPQVRWDLADDWQIHLEPELNYPVGDLSENPDITRYRGIFNLKTDFVQHSGFKLGAYTYLGTRLDRGAFQLDVSYPMTEMTNGWVNCFLYAQWFDGWAESLRAYNVRTNRVLFGIAFIR